MKYMVMTSADGMPWCPAYLPNERAPRHSTREEAAARIEFLKGLDDPMWREAKYKVVWWDKSLGCWCQ